MTKLRIRSITPYGRINRRQLPCLRRFELYFQVTMAVTAFPTPLRRQGLAIGPSDVVNSLLLAVSSQTHFPPDLALLRDHCCRHCRHRQLRCAS